MRKVSEYCQELVSSGLVSHDEALRITLVAALMPAQHGSHPLVTTEQLIDAAGIDQDSLADQVEILGKLGIAVEQVRGAGYRLVDDLADLLAAEAVVPRLLERLSSARKQAGTPVVGLPYRYFTRHGSTNRWLKSEAAGLPSGTVAVTDDQTEGRGRLGRTWWSEPGKDLTFSVLLRPSALAYDAGLLPLTAGLSVAEVLEGLPGLGRRVRIKWPNDVLIDDRKVCGILLESSSQGEDLQWIVVGIGLNVNSDPASRLRSLGSSEKEVWRGRSTPTSLSAESGEKVARGALLAELLTRLKARWFDSDVKESLAGLRLRDALLGRQIELHAGPPEGGLMLAGEAAGIDDRGRLLVRGTGGTTTPVSAGEVTLSVDSLTE